MQGHSEMAYFGYNNKLRAGENIQIINYSNFKCDLTFLVDIVGGLLRYTQKPPARVVGEYWLTLSPYAVYNIGKNGLENSLDFVYILQQELISTGVPP